MEPIKIDFKKINRLLLRDLGMKESEVSEMMIQGNTCIHELKNPDHTYAIGYLNGNKFIHMAYQIAKDPKFEIEALQIGIPNVNRIKRYWCK